MEMPFKTYQKRPNKSRMEIEIQGSKMVMAFDGENGLGNTAMDRLCRSD